MANTENLDHPGLSISDELKGSSATEPQKDAESDNSNKSAEPKLTNEDLDYFERVRRRYEELVRKEEDTIRI